MSAERWFQARRARRFADVRRAGAVIAAFWWAMIAVGAADPGDPAEAGRQNPVHIQSELLEAEMDANTVEFIDAVRVHGDGYTITADRLTIQFRQGSSDRNRLAGTISAKEISRMTARGRVRIRTGTLTADAEQAVYEPDAGRVWLEPTPASEASSLGRRPAGTRVRITLLPGTGP